MAQTASEKARSYEGAIQIIESRQRKARPTTASTNAGLGAVKQSSSSGTPGLRGAPSIEGMSDWLRALGYSQKDLSSLNIIHVAGTKGKGSTCAFVESILRSLGNRISFPRKTGLYTSPHLIKPEERIRINSQPLAPDLFAKYLWELYDKLPQLTRDYDPSLPLVERGPRFLQLFALLAFHIFIREGVDVAIIETHSGGEYDATNVVQHPVVTAITALGMDHIDMLGPTIENIAWHKAGIFKSGAVALSTTQEAGLEQVLADRVAEKAASLTIINDDARLPPSALQLKPHVQRKNASLAIAACEAWLHQRTELSTTLTTEDINTGIRQWSWPGRFQTIHDKTGQTAWFLDAAHNDMSVRLAAQWFGERSFEISSIAARILVFTHIDELRDAEALLRTLAMALRDAGLAMDHVIFTTYHAREAAALEAKASVPPSFHAAWEDVFPESQRHDKLSIERALERARTLAPNGKEAHVLVTGSQHLIGPGLQILAGSGAP